MQHPHFLGLALGGAGFAAATAAAELPPAAGGPAAASAAKLPVALPLAGFQPLVFGPPGGQPPEGGRGKRKGGEGGGPPARMDCPPAAEHPVAVASREGRRGKEAEGLLAASCPGHWGTSVGCGPYRHSCGR